MNHGQTACLAVAGQIVAKDQFGYQCALRNLTKEAKRTDKNEEYEIDSKTNLLQMLWKFYSSKKKLYHEFSNKNQLIWILNAKDMIKTILLSFEIVICYYSP